jgi:transcriptional regulator with XRE-family HTH domain
MPNFVKGEQIMYEIFEQLLLKHNVTTYKVAKETGIGQSTFTAWKTGVSTPKQDKLQLIADYFGVSIDYLITGREDITEIPKSLLTLRDEKDIAKDLNSIMKKLNSDEDGPINFNGVDMSEETTELFRDELELMLKRLKAYNKALYNPNKNKK